MVRGASFGQLKQRLGSLAAFFFLCSVAVNAGAQCVSDPPAAATINTHSVSIRSAAAWQLACRRFSATTRDTRISLDSSSDTPSIDTQNRIEAEIGSPIAARFDMRWQSSIGPAWVQSVPQWVTSDARNYHRRGLPLLQLWQSHHYLVALGFSNHGVPGVYFSQKLP
jgi:hypothetical protein